MFVLSRLDNLHPIGCVLKGKCCIVLVLPQVIKCVYHIEYFVKDLATHVHDLALDEWLE